MNCMHSFHCKHCENELKIFCSCCQTLSTVTWHGLMFTDLNETRVKRRCCGVLLKYAHLFRNEAENKETIQLLGREVVVQLRSSIRKRS